VSPTPLGVLPSDKPIPNQRCQIAIGGYEGANNWQAGDAGITMPYMTISYRPTYDCWWVVRSNQIATGVNGGWQRWDHSIICTPADLDGYNEARIVTDCYDAGTVGWCAWAGCAGFRLGAGTLYTASLVMQYSSGGIQQSYGGSQYSRIIGVAYGEGVS
jgi:hypothetical protein